MLFESMLTVSSMLLDELLKADEEDDFDLDFDD